jgi:hypothetical protein
VVMLEVEAEEVVGWLWKDGDIGGDVIWMF